MIKIAKVYTKQHLPSFHKPFKYLWKSHNYETPAFAVAQMNHMQHDVLGFFGYLMTMC
jgi:hypothetical protein